MQTNPYDRFPYRSLPYYESHPDRLRFIAHLFGVEAAPVERCRVLEVGCASGGNLIPTAELHPRSEFLGIDLAGSAIAEGQETIAALGLENIELRQLDLAALEPAAGSFDYIIAHGVYSWVPPATSAALLDLVARHLAPGGIAFISHNVKPGFYSRLMAREIMLWHAGGIADEQEKVDQARAFLSMIVSAARPDLEARRDILMAELAFVKGLPDWLVRHDYLEEAYHACYFEEMHAELERRGLSFLGDSELSKMLSASFPEEVQRSLAEIAGNLARHEQLLDFVRLRAFRLTIACRDGIAIDRALRPERMRGLHLSGRLAEDKDGNFNTPPGGSVRSERPETRAALRRILDAWPRSVPFEELDGPGVDRDLLGCLVRDILLGQLSPTRCVVPAGERPRATAYARYLAARGAFVTNLRHENVRLEPQVLRLLVLLDGTRDRAALAREVGGSVDVAAALDELAAKGLLLA
jgi:SAM-dependent methyltransferase